MGRLEDIELDHPWFKAKLSRRERRIASMSKGKAPSMRRIKFVKTVVAIIEYPDGSLLLQKRAVPPYKGVWGLPGGHVKAGEEEVDALEREVLEEVGVKVRTLLKLGTYLEEGQVSGLTKYYFANCYVARPLEGRPRPQPGEVSEVKLFRIDEMPAELSFRHKEMIQDYQTMKTQASSMT